MLHVPASTFAPAGAGAGAPTSPAPLTPAEYIRLRREAAGLSLEAVAAMLRPRAEDRPRSLVFLRLIESPRARCNEREPLLMLRSCFPFDPDVYLQLATEPADRHPAVCRGCGCSHWDPCDDETAGACAWATPALCTRCLGEGA